MIGLAQIKNLKVLWLELGKEDGKITLLKETFLIMFILEQFLFNPSREIKKLLLENPT